MLGLITASIAFSPMAYAADYFVYPLKIEKVVKKNSNLVTGSVQASNSTGDIITLKVNTQIWDMKPNGTLGVISNPSEADSAILQNFKVNPLQFSLGAREERLIRFAFKPPADTDKEYHVQLVFEQIGTVKPDTVVNLTPATNLKTQIKVLTNFATNIYIYQGNVKTNTQLEKVECNYITNTKKLQLKLALTNKGTLHSRFKGLLLVSQSNSVDKVGDIKSIPVINGAIIAVLPEHERLVDQQIDFAEFSPGSYDINIHLADERGFDPPIDKTCSFIIPNN